MSVAHQSLPEDRPVRLALAGMLLALGAGLLGGFVLLGVLVARALPGVPELDAAVATGLHDYVTGHRRLETTLVVLAQVTEPFVLRAVFLVPAVVLWRNGAQRAVAWMVTTLVVGGGLNALIKLIVNRARPDLPDPIALTAGASFPSGHTTNAVLFAGIVVVLLDPALRGHLRLPGDGLTVRDTPARSALWASATAFAGLVAFDRVGLGVHYLTDVVGGAAFGLSVVVLTLVAFSRSRTLRLWPRRHPGDGSRRPAPAEPRHPRQH